MGRRQLSNNIEQVIGNRWSYLHPLDNLGTPRRLRPFRPFRVDYSMLFRILELEVHGQAVLNCRSVIVIIFSCRHPNLVGSMVGHDVSDMFFSFEMCSGGSSSLLKLKWKSKFGEIFCFHFNFLICRIKSI